ncbi:MFS transporter [Nakamurella sp.]|uniref:MFS transporter n=1 Tax=Nakamurella sp. TaxID=1869182 RepID=UPI0037840276
MSPTPSTTVPGLADKTQMRRVLFSSFLGSAVEFYDFLLYGTAAALVFGQLFFSDLSPVVATIASFGTLAVGYIVRPLGGVIFGHFGDRIGRKSMLVLTMTLMGAASFAIGLLPTYATIGAAAPILLILLRLIQGFAVGGEWGGAALMALEHSDENRRGFSASFANMGAPAGAVLSTVVLAIVTLLPGDAFLSWGWRIPFLLSAVLVGIGLYVRLKVTESPLFEQEVITAVAVDPTVKKRLPIIDVLRTNPVSVLLGIGAGLGAFALQALMATFALTIGVQGGLTRSTVLWLFAAGSLLQIFALPAYAALSDRIGRRPVMISGCLAAVVAVYPILLLIDSGSALGVLLGFVIAMPLVQAAMYGPLAAFTTEIFATGNRYTGASLGYQLSSTLGGGFAPLIAATLVAGTTTGNGLLRVAVFAATAALISAITIALAKESSRRTLVTTG